MSQPQSQPQSPTVADKLKSDRLWALGGYLILVAASPDLGLSPELMTQAAAVVGSFILGKSWRPSGAGAVSKPEAKPDAPQAVDTRE